MSRQDDKHEIKSYLIDMQRNRRKHQKEVLDSDRGVASLEWVILERNAYHDVINAIRARRGLKPAPRKNILRAENAACGHFDYTDKLAVYGAEMCETEDGGPLIEKQTGGAK